MKNKKEQKLLCGIGTLVVCFMLTGCHMSHEWQEATCTTPRTCLTGGETDGEPLGHTWVEATCSEAKHCSVCGETEGEPLPHTLTEANYQQPATCEVCGETVGEPLQADFEKFGLECNAKLDTEYPFVIPCYHTTEYTTAGKITFSDYEVFDSDDTHEALEGYEWRAVTITIVFDDDNAYNIGFSGFTLLLTDYYCDFDNTYNESSDTYTLNYNGTDYADVKVVADILQSGWNNDIYTYQSRLTLCVPKGYDGLVATVVRYDSSTWNNDAPLTEKVNDDTVFFRLK